MSMKIKFRLLEIGQLLKQLVKDVVSMDCLLFIGDPYEISAILLHPLQNA
jgi:hypothetical protein